MRNTTFPPFVLAALVVLAAAAQAEPNCAPVPVVCAEDTPCDDGNACTVEDRCDANGWCAGDLRDCDDGDPCTEDRCDPATGCEYTFVPCAVPVVTRGAVYPYRMQITLSVTNTGGPLDQLHLIFPLAQDNDYQVVLNPTFAPAGGEVIAIPDTDDAYRRFTVTGVDLPPPGETRDWVYTFDVALWDLSTDFARIGAQLPYDTDSDLYRWYTGPSVAYARTTGGNDRIIDPENPSVVTWAAAMWDEAEGDLVDYARRAFDFTVEYVTYYWDPLGTNPATVADVIDAGHGFCVSFHILYASLLRAMGIPTRPLLSPTLNGVGHGWADFYLEGYGWIPVDAAFADGDPAGDYFGNLPHDTAHGPIVSKEVDLLIDFETWTFLQGGMQAPFAIAYPFGGATIEQTFTVTATPSQ